MQFRKSSPNAVFVGIFAIALSLPSLVSPNEAWAKHKKNHSAVNSDPCAVPTAFVKDHIAKIRALRASNAEHKTTSVYGLFSSSSNTSEDQDTNIKVSELRRDADGVNDLLRTSECKPIDIDKEIKAPGAQATTAAEVLKKRR
ncbi:hypothetical protein [Hyphomicrobium sp.]|jgi:hypothetical protein|uniref:hypothetical protein n=1 Tax=Hyphomicrobium sp. TaxID=82 RepID=UPI003562DCCE